MVNLVDHALQSEFFTQEYDQEYDKTFGILK